MEFCVTFLYLSTKIPMKVFLPWLLRYSKTHWLLSLMIWIVMFCTWTNWRKRKLNLFQLTLPVWIQINNTSQLLKVDMAKRPLLLKTEKMNVIQTQLCQGKFSMHIFRLFLIQKLLLWVPYGTFWSFFVPFGHIWSLLLFWGWLWQCWHPIGCSWLLHYQYLENLKRHALNKKMEDACKLIWC